MHITQKAKTDTLLKFKTPLLIHNACGNALNQCCYIVTWSLRNILHWNVNQNAHYGDVIMGEIASQITSLTIVYSTVYSDVNQRKHQSSASVAWVRGIHRKPVNSPHKWPVTRKMFPFDDVIMNNFHCAICIWKCRMQNDMCCFWHR